MFSHMMVGSNDLDRSKKFYDALFGAIGGKPVIVDDRGRLIYLHKGGIFMVTAPIDGAAACHANGGTPIEEDPGIRAGGFGQLYLAYLRDPDGNKLCGLHRLS